MKRVVSWIGIVATVLIIWAAPPLIIRMHTSSWTESGVIGDSFGVANSLIAGLAFIGVVYSIYRQGVDAESRDIQLRNEQSTSLNQIYQLALSNQLQICRALAAENRRSIIELRPSIAEVPTSSMLIKDILHRITEEKQHPSSLDKTTEVIRLLNELLELGAQIQEIQEKLQKMRVEFEAQQSALEAAK